MPLLKLLVNTISKLRSSCFYLRLHGSSFWILHQFAPWPAVFWTPAYLCILEANALDEPKLQRHFLVFVELYTVPRVVTCHMSKLLLAPPLIMHLRMSEGPLFWTPTSDIVSNARVIMQFHSLETSCENSYKVIALTSTSRFGVVLPQVSST